MVTSGLMVVVSCFGLSVYSVDASKVTTSCYNGWLAFEGSCYYFGHEAMPFTNAVEYCRERHNSHLIHVENGTENSFIKDQLRTNFKERNWWLGLTDEEIEGLWRWVDTDTPATYLDWYPGQPNVHTDDCARFATETDVQSKFQWADNSCSTSCFPLCELSGAENEPEIIG